MKVGFFIPVVGRGGVESSLAKLLSALADTELDATVLYGIAPADWLESVKDICELVELEPQSLVPLAGRFVDHRASLSMSLVRDLAAQMHQIDLDVLVGYQSGAMALLARRMAKIDIPVVVRESIVPTRAYAGGNPLMRILKKRVKGFSFSRADAVIAVCKGASDDLGENFGVPEELIHVVFNPAVPGNIGQLVAEPIEHPWFDDSSMIPVISSVGRLSEQKDLPTTLRAVAEILKTREVRLVMLGTGPLENELAALAKELGISEHVWFAGFQSNPYKYMAKSNAFVLTSIYEGIANVLAEALASGVPVVATDCPTGPDEVLLSGRAGKLVPVGDHIAVAAAVTHFLDDPHANDAYREGIIESLERFQPEMAAKAYIDLMQKLS